MNFWVLSPNVTANGNEEPIWKDLIQKKHLAFMGWGEGDKFGDMFIEQIKIDDVLLVAQGANRQKRVFLCGIVSSDAKNDHIQGAPRATLYRQLKDVVTKEQLEAIGLNFNGCAFGDADQIPALYKLKPSENNNDKRISDQLYKKIKEMVKLNELSSVISLLTMKKQIVLQGPPGTGKTRLAKELSRRLIGISQGEPRELNDDEILNGLKEVTTIGTVVSRTEYTLYDVNPTTRKVTLKRSNGSTGETTFEKINSFYKNQRWKESFHSNDDRRAAAIAQCLDEKMPKVILEDSSQFKLIQFHPAYSYEDFVRGISAKPNGNAVEYITENRVFAEFAVAAYKNYLDSKKDIASLSRQAWAEQMFEGFKDHVEDVMDQEDEQKRKYHISPSVHIYNVDEDSFRYTGDNWATKNYRILFSDIIKLFLADVTERKQIKQHTEVTGRAKQHATYYFNLLSKFREFIGEMSFDARNTVKIEERPYILIIDEINRANLPAVLGELIYALEYRGERVDGIYEYEGDRGLILPPNLYIIGTMNTADRSVGHIDYAIRRRFAFVDVLPNLDPIKDIAKSLFKAVSELFIKNFDTLNWSEPKPEKSDFLAADFRAEDVWLGHSYFITEEEGDAGKKELELRLKYEIKPILKEYVKDGILNDHQGQKILDKIAAFNV